eukprot:13661970-Heterocapsa_arctica.AAC.1
MVHNLHAGIVGQFFHLGQVPREVAVRAVDDDLLTSTGRVLGASTLEQRDCRAWCFSACLPRTGRSKPTSACPCVDAARHAPA